MTIQVTVETRQTWLSAQGPRLSRVRPLGRRYLSASAPQTEPQGQPARDPTKGNAAPPTSLAKVL